MVAAEYGNLEVAETLIAAHADLNPQDKDGLTPLMKAAKFNHPEVLRALLAAKADVGIKSNDGKTALELAGDQADIRALLHAAAKP
jgi:ankyrin repeat protein